MGYFNLKGENVIKIEIPVQKEVVLQVKVIQCPDSMLWYRKYIGEVFTPFREERTMWWVRDKDGYSNFIYKTDSEILKEETDANTHG